MAVILELLDFWWAKNQKNKVRNNVQVIILKFKMATTNHFLNICDPKNS